MHAEPDSLTNIATLWKSGVLDHDQYEHLLVSTIRLLGRSLKPGISRVCVKVRSTAVCHVEAIRTNFPKTKFVFNYRNCLGNVKSCHRAVCFDLFGTLNTYIMDNDTISDWFPYFRKSFCAMLVDNQSEFNPFKLNSTEIYTLSWALCMDVMIRFRDNGGNFIPVLYEDLMADKSMVMHRLLKGLGINTEHVDKTLQAFNKDSQDHTPISHSNLQAAVQRKIPREHIRSANVILRS